MMSGGTIRAIIDSNRCWTSSWFAEASLFRMGNHFTIVGGGLHGGRGLLSWSVVPAGALNKAVVDGWIFSHISLRHG
jgi:hypothetical protein